jgi:hypothetical protein
VPGYGADEDGRLTAIAERPPDGADRLRQRAVRDNHIGPHAVEDLLPAHGAMPLFEQEEEEIEVSRNDADHLVLPAQHPPRRRDQEGAEAIAHPEMLPDDLTQISWRPHLSLRTRAGLLSEN